MTFEQITEEINRELNTLNTEVRAQVKQTQQDLVNLESRFDLLQKQVNAIDHIVERRKDLGGISFASRDAWSGDVINKVCQELPALDKYGKVRCEVRTITSVGLAPAASYPEIGLAGAPSYGRVRQLLHTMPIDSAAVFAVSESSASGWAAAPQVEGSAKSESDVTLTAATIPIRTIATWVGVSRQALDDVRGLEAFIQARLLWALEKAIEEQILLGSGSGENLKGLVVAAQNFDTSIPPSGANHADQLAGAALQVRQNGFMPTFIVLAPVTAYQLRITKNLQNDYLDYSGLSLPQIVESPAMSAGTFLVGDSAQAVIRSRQAATIEMSTEHADFFTKNLVAIRAEERLALQILSSSAFVKGTLA